MILTRLIQGDLCQEGFDILISLTNVRSEYVILALKLHLVDGWSTAMAYQAAGIHQQAFDRGFKALNKAYVKIVTFSELQKTTVYRC